MKLKQLFSRTKVWRCKLCGNKVPITNTAESRLAHLKHNHKKEMWYKLDAFEVDWI
jgi:hypothetical protein